MNDKAIKYAPRIYMDKLEPFKIRYVGVAEYKENGEKSLSFNRKFDFSNFEGTACVLEYVYYLDYDIQHLYDLEHIWVYLGADGRVTGAEGSYHGRFLNALNQEFGGSDEENRLVMYSQPGKHAMLADPKLMYLYSELYSSCDRLAGINGLDAPERFLKDIHISAEENQKVADHIRANYSFVPSMEFVEAEISGEMYVEWEVLEKKIPDMIKRELERILDF